MKNIAKLALFASVAIASFSCQDQEIANVVEKDRAIIPGKYIVTFKEGYIPHGRLGEPVFFDRDAKVAFAKRKGAEVTRKINGFLQEQGIDKVDHIYDMAIAGFAASLTDEQVANLKNNPQVAAVEEDRIVNLEKFDVESVAGPEARTMAQTTPCGITNAGGSADGSAKSAWIWVIDSGIDMDHPDLNVVTNTAYAKTFVSGTTSPDDQNGHGTHCAGIAAAKNNTIGVIGVSAGAAVVPVRVFGASGGSSTSTIVAGINHVAANDVAGDVASMSLGGYYGTSGCSTGSSYLTAINNLGTTSWVSIAAGNDAANAAFYQPACINGTKVFTVASMTCSKTWSSFSNWNGTSTGPVDWIATGSSVYSTYLNGGYATLSGTSMACPTVSGILHQRNAAPVSKGTVVRSSLSYKIAGRI